MIQLMKQARAAFGLLHPQEVRRRAERQVHVGLVASGEQGYSEMEDFLVPQALPREQRIELMSYVHRAGDLNVPPKVEVVLYEENLEPGKGAYTFHDAFVAPFIPARPVIPTRRITVDSPARELN